MICSRQPRALDICVNMLERAQKNVDTVEEEAEVLSIIGGLRLLQGPSQYLKSVKCFKEAIRKDGSNVNALQGMIMYLLYKGQYEEAEGQLELLTMMHQPEDLGHEYYYIKSCLSKHLHKNLKEHVDNLDECKKYLFRQVSENGRMFYSQFNEILGLNPDFAVTLAVDYFNQVQSNVMIPFTGNTVPGSNNENEDMNSGAGGMNSSGATMDMRNKNTTMLMGTNNKGMTMTMGMGGMTTMGMGEQVGLSSYFFHRHV